MTGLEKMKKVSEGHWTTTGWSKSKEQQRQGSEGAPNLDFSSFSVMPEVPGWGMWAIPRILL